MTRFEDKVALVTGAGSGIGRATAQLLAREGAAVGVADLRGEAGEETVASIAEAGGEAMFVAVDVSQAADVRRMIATVAERYGGLDVLHNNAGIFPTPTPIEEMDEALFDAVLGVNLKGVWLGCKYAAPVMRAAGGGAIVNTASMAGIRARPNHSAYTSSKGAVVMLTKTLALEFGPDRIRVNCVCPGGVNTPMIRPEGVSADDYQEQSRELMRRAPINRFARPEEIAEAVAYLASEQASYVNGFALWVEGGSWAGESAGMRRHEQG